MRVKFSGKSSEYEIEKSHFCANSFVVKDKVANRDETDFITSNVEFLDFSDESFAYKEVIEFLEKSGAADIIVVDEFFENKLKKSGQEFSENKTENEALQTSEAKATDSTKTNLALNSAENLGKNSAQAKNANLAKENFKDKNENLVKENSSKILNKNANSTQEKQGKSGEKSFVLSDNFSRIFSKNLFIKTKKEFEKSEILELLSTQKFEFFKNLDTLEKDLKNRQEFSFVKIEILNYEENNDSISFELELFPSGVRYKYGIYGRVLRMILSGKMQSEELLSFLKSFVYKSKEQILGEKIFTLVLNEIPIYKLTARFTS